MLHLYNESSINQATLYIPPTINFHFYLLFNLIISVQQRLGCYANFVCKSAGHPPRWQWQGTNEIFERKRKDAV